jgi:serine/threonine-protein kinase
MVDLKLLGGCALERNGVPVTGPAAQRHRLALLALLARSPRGGVPRERLLATLWPERDEASARNLLKQAVFVLRRELGAEAVTGGAELRLNPTLIRCDTTAFELALAEGRPAEAVELYRGPFLDGFHLGHDAEVFERWTDTERAELAGGHLLALERLAGEAERQSDPGAAIVWWRRLVAADPLNAGYTRRLMEVLAGSGDAAGAVRQFRAYRKLLEGELSVPADPALAELAERLAREPTPPRRRRSPRPAARAPTPPAPADSPGRPAAAGPRRWVQPLAIALVLAVGGYLMVTRFRGGTARQRLDPSLVAIAPFGVFEPGLELWREGLVDVLSHELDGAGPLRTVSPSVVLDRWDGPPDAASAARLARETGAGIAVVGTLVRAGQDSVRLTASLIEAASGRVLADVTRHDAVASMDRLADSVTLSIMRALRQELPPGAVPRSGMAAASMEATKLFLQGEQFFRRTQWDSAQASYEKVIARDTGFALAYHRLGEVLGWRRVNYDSLASFYLLRAGALNRGLSLRDSLLLRADSLTAAENATDDPLVSWNAIRQLFSTVSQAADRYPADPEVWYAVGEARYHFGAGPGVSVSYRATLDAFDRAIALDSGFAPAYLHPIELGFTLDGRELGLRYARAYLALQPTDGAHAGVILLERLVSMAPGDEPHALLDTASADVLVPTRTRLRRWLDSSETAVQLGRILAAGRHAEYALFADTALMRRRLAETLAYRGHLRQAAAVLGTEPTGLYVDLAYLGAVPNGQAGDTFRRWLAEDRPAARWGLAWWSLHRDSTSLAAFAARARSRAGTARTPVERLEAAYDTAAAAAHLALVRGDTAASLDRFLALPDSACTRCYLDRLTRARLLSARRRDREALRVLSERLVPFLTPMELIFTLERGSVLARLGDRRTAAGLRKTVERAWHSGDPELRGLVARARGQ